MSNIVAQQTANAIDTAIASLSQQSIDILRDMYYKGAPDRQIELAHAYCVSRGLDHALRPVYLVQTKGEWAMWPSIYTYRTIAARSMWAGISEPEYGPPINIGGKDVPEWCKITVKRLLPGNFLADFSATVFAEEFFKPFSPNWKQSPRHMLAIRAEAHALRRAFPEVGGIPTFDEIDGTLDDHSDVQSLVDSVKQTLNAKRSGHVAQAPVRFMDESGAVTEVAAPEVPIDAEDVSVSEPEAPAADKPPAVEEISAVDDDSQDPATKGEKLVITRMLTKNGLTVDQVTKGALQNLDTLTKGQFRKMRAIIQKHEAKQSSAA